VANYIAMSNTELTVHKGELLEMVANHAVVGRIASVRSAPIRTDVFDIVSETVSRHHTVHEKINK